MSQLRSKARAHGASVRVVKNRLAKIALKGTNLELATSLLVGPTVLAYSSDVISAPKAVVSYAGINAKLVVLGGVMDGQFLDANKMKALGNLPSLDELRGKLVGLLQAPASKLARVFSAYADKDQ
jgi:large subunit ribosomal protein L10